jgi:uncharacterized lipoprotein YmbA
MSVLFRRGAVLAMLSLPLWGCGSYPLPKVYVLGEQTAPTAGVMSRVGIPVIELRPVSVPDDQDSTDIVRRKGAHEVVASPTGQWNVRLSVGVTNALASDLRRRLPDMIIATRPSSAPSARIVVDVDRFEIAADGVCSLTARWRVAATSAKSPALSEEGTFVERPGAADDAAAAGGMTSAIDQLAAHVAATTLRTLASDRSH